MNTMKVWLLVVFGVVTCGEYCEDTRRPMIVIDNLASREQCIALGTRLAGKTTNGSYDCTGLSKVKQ
jgi:hypothetical protein